MGLLQLILLLIAAVLVSALLAQVIPKISTPLVQIGIGVCIALFTGYAEQIDIPAELFMVLFIAPLLFDEAKGLDRTGFWHNRRMIISLALGLVVAITLSVGFALNAIMPSIGLAAAFALGAALGPTDAVAVASMSNVAALSDKQKSTLQGEALINDASCIVAFQFAIAAATTGTFSLLEAGTTFCIEFFGGIALGVLIGFLCNLFIAFVQDKGLESEIFSVLFDLALPFVVYMLGDSVHVSGVLAVVACGIVFQLSPRTSGPVTSKLSIVSTSTWHVVTFALNGIVFVLLGVMLPSGITGYIDGVSYINWNLLAIGEFVALVVILCRFIWVVVMERIFGEAKKIDGTLLKHALVLTLAGAKGAITLSIAMTIPAVVVGRNDMIFFASCAVLTTLLLANFLIPVLAPADAVAAEEKATKERETYLEILRKVVEKLTSEMPNRNGGDVMACLSVIEEYNTRIDELKEAQEITPDDEHLVGLRIKALGWQKERAIAIADDASSQYPDEVVDAYIAELNNAIDKIRQRKNFTWFLERKSRRMRTMFRTLTRVAGIKKAFTSDEQESMRQLQVDCRSYALDKLASFPESSEYENEEIAFIAAEYQRAIAFTQRQSLSMSQVLRVDDRKDNVRLEALRYEMAFVNDAYAEGKIDRATATKFRRKVAVMQLDVSGEL